MIGLAVEASHIPVWKYEFIFMVDMISVLWDVSILCQPYHDVDMGSFPFTCTLATLNVSLNFLSRSMTISNFILESSGSISVFVVD